MQFRPAMSVLMLTTPGILVRSPRTEAAQPPQCMFGTLRLISVAPLDVFPLSAATAVASLLSLVVATGAFDPVHPTNASKATCKSTTFVLMSSAPDRCKCHGESSLDCHDALSARVNCALNTVFPALRQTDTAAGPSAAGLLLATRQQKVPVVPNLNTLMRLGHEKTPVSPATTFSRVQQRLVIQAEPENLSCTIT